MALPGQAVVSIEKVTAQYNDNPRGEGIEKLADRDNNTKYLTFHRHGWVLMQAAGAHEVNSYEFVSANDAPERDPMSWSLYGSNDRITWSLLDRRNDVVFQSRRLTIRFDVRVPQPFVFFRFDLRNAGGGELHVADIALFGALHEGSAPGPPAQPTGCTATPASRGSILVGWQDNADDEHGGIIQTSPDLLHWTTAGRFGPDAVHTTLSGLSDSTHYHVRVVAFNAAGSSMPSNTASTMTTPMHRGDRPIKQRMDDGDVYYERDIFSLVFTSYESVTDSVLMDSVARRFFHVYPQLVDRFNQHAPPKLYAVLDPGYQGVAAVNMTRIILSTNHFALYPHDLDVITHELMHVVQAYHKGELPAWLVEGMADYVRFIYGVDNQRTGWKLPEFSPFQHYTDSYGITARFLLWLEQQYGTSLLDAIDAVLRDGNYSNVMWVEKTSLTIDQLWKAYTSDPTLTHVQYEPGGGASVRFCMYPHPVADVLSIEFVLPHPSEVLIDVCDLGGRIVASTPHTWRAGGSHTIAIDLRGHPPGTYVCRVTTDTAIEMDVFVLTP
jgi:hypothetical protein